jgi:hypothetical protein
MDMRSIAARPIISHRWPSVCNAKESPVLHNALSTTKFIYTVQARGRGLRFLDDHLFFLFLLRLPLPHKPIGRVMALAEG